MTRPAAPHRPTSSAPNLRLGVLLLSLGAVGCTKRVDAPGAKGSAGEPAVDVAADRAVIRTGWILALAGDPAELGVLAGSNPGWRALFGGDPVAALKAFEADRGGGADARIGASRAALEVAAAHAFVARTLAAATPTLLRAQATRPDAARSAGGRAWVLDRLKGLEGQAATFAEVGPPGPLSPLCVASRAGARGAVADLLAGRPGGADAQAPAALTAAGAARLRTMSLVAAGRLKEARRGWARVDARAPDLRVGAGDAEVVLRDPVAALAGQRLYAGIALKAVEGLTGWPQLLRARALLLLDRAPEAVELLRALLAKPPAPAALAQRVLSGTQGPADLPVEGRALLAVALAEAGSAAEAQRTARALPETTIRRRVLRSWARAMAGDPVEPGAFPEDRSTLSHAFTAEITQLGEGAKGAGDVTELALVERTVDRVQRRYAAAMQRAGHSVLAVKAREAAEDKAHVAHRSPRNSLSSLAGTAYDELRVGRPRVALKYLTRLGKHLPAAEGPADMLRDLLSLRAMEQGGGATVGQ